MIATAFKADEGPGKAPGRFDSCLLRQNRRVRWLWMALTVLAVVGVVAAYRTMGWALLRPDHQ